MRPRAFAVLALALLACGCQRFTPPVQPNVSLFPTAFPVRILDQSAATELPVSSLRQVFEHTGWADGLGSFGLSESNAALLARGLRQRGYAELDARRAEGSIRWIVLRVLPGNQALLATAGYEHRPPNAHLAGTNLTQPPAESTRTDAYNYPIKVQTWQGQRANVPMTVEHVRPVVTGREEYWEIRHLIPLRDLEDE
ncbi:MAG: hypothetical protein RBU25_04990 [Lentisphaeria bacterium]|nr:hypothetical protein [Lentisphaeria bacterium]